MLAFLCLPRFFLVANKDYCSALRSYSSSCVVVADVCLEVKPVSEKGFEHSWGKAQWRDVMVMEAELIIRACRRLPRDQVYEFRLRKFFQKSAHPKYFFRRQFWNFINRACVHVQCGAHVVELCSSTSFRSVGSVNSAEATVEEHRASGHCTRERSTPQVLVLGLL